MKKSITLICLALIISSASLAQDQSAIAREKMRKLSFIAGQWKGEALISQRSAPPIKVNQEEKIEWQLDSLVLCLEGTGRKQSDPDKISFHAFAVINYNVTTQSYNMRSFLMDGKQTDAFFNEVGENKFDWGFDVPGGKVVYHITLDPANRKWTEKGEFSRDGKQWFTTVEMNLTKLN